MVGRDVGDRGQGGVTRPRPRKDPAWTGIESHGAGWRAVVSLGPGASSGSWYGSGACDVGIYNQSR